MIVMMNRFICVMMIVMMMSSGSSNAKWNDQRWLLSLLLQLKVVLTGVARRTPHTRGDLAAAHRGRSRSRSTSATPAPFTSVPKIQFQIRNVLLLT